MDPIWTGSRVNGWVDLVQIGSLHVNFESEPEFFSIQCSLNM